MHFIEIFSALKNGFGLLSCHHRAENPYENYLAHSLGNWKILSLNS